MMLARLAEDCPIRKLFPGRQTEPTVVEQPSPIPGYFFLTPPCSPFEGKQQFPSKRSNSCFLKQELPVGTRRSVAVRLATANKGSLTPCSTIHSGVQTPFKWDL